MNKDYELLGFVAKHTNLCVSDIESVLQYACKYAGNKEEANKPRYTFTCIKCGYKEKRQFTRMTNCPECKGLLVDVYEKDIMDKVLQKAGYVQETDKQEQSLLSITLQNETSDPKVIYKGEEIKYKISLSLEWETDRDIAIGGLTYAIEHAETGKGYPSVNRIERRVKGHA